MYLKNIRTQIKNKFINHVKNFNDQGEYLKLIINKITNIGINTNKLTNKQYTWFLNARSHLLPTKYNLKYKNINNLDNTTCRRCHIKEKTRDHILNKCVHIAKYMKARHNKIINTLVKNARLDNAIFKIDKRYSKNNNLQPDLIILNKNQNYNILFDVAVTLHNIEHCELGHNLKIKKYKDLIELHKNTHNKELKMLPAIFTSLGSYHNKIYKVFQILNINPKPILKIRKDITLNIIKDSKLIYDKFIKNNNKPIQKNNQINNYLIHNNPILQSTSLYTHNKLNHLSNNFNNSNTKFKRYKSKQSNSKPIKFEQSNSKQLQSK